MDAGERGAPWLLFAAAGVLLVSCLAAFWRSRVRLVGLWEPEYAGPACPPPHSGTRLVAGSPGWPLAVLVVGALAGLAASLAVVPR